VLIREDDAFHPEGAKKNYTRIRGEKEKDSQLDGIKDPDGGKDLEDLSKSTNNFSLLLGLSLSKQWIMILTARYLVQPDDR
jgi:hypothetical protein